MRSQTLSLLGRQKTIFSLYSYLSNQVLKVFTFMTVEGSWRVNLFLSRFKLQWLVQVSILTLVGSPKESHTYKTSMKYR